MSKYNKAKGRVVMTGAKEIQKLAENASKQTDKYLEAEIIKEEKAEAKGRGKSNEQPKVEPISVAELKDMEETLKPFFGAPPKRASRRHHLSKWRPGFARVAFYLTKIGMFEKDIAAIIGVSDRTFTEWKNARRPLQRALEKGVAERNRNILNAALTAGLRDRNVIMLIFLLKNYLGFKDRQDVHQTGEMTVVYKSHIPKEKKERSKAEEGA
jgi:hypothetical protein